MRLLLLVTSLASVSSLLGLTACETIKPYEKEFLLGPLMDDAGVATLTPSLISAAAAGHEKLASGAQASGGTSCPTCGG